MTPGANAPNKEPQDLSNLTVRFITALIGAPIVLIVVYMGGWLFTVLVAALAVVALLEFYALGRDHSIQGSVWAGVPASLAIFLVCAASDFIWLPPIFLIAGAAAFARESVRGTPQPIRSYRLLTTWAGLLYVALPSACLVAIRARPDGLMWTGLILAIAWGTDTFAYFGGRLWGKHPLAPRISPKKTIEGALVGLATGFTLAILWLALNNQLAARGLILAALGPPVAMLGDLFESRIKRFFHAGDSHLAGLNLIPGHGGVLDRIDSLIWVVLLVYIILALHA